MTRLRAVVFDFDGVILESADVKTDAFVALYASHGPAIAAKVRDHHLQNLGISRFKKFEWIAKNLLDQELTDEASRAMGERFSALALEGVLAAPFVPGADGALETLAGRLPLYVASGTPDDELKMIVERRGLASRFHEVHGTPREKPEILRDLMDRHCLATHEVLFVGDGMSDYKAARAVGVEFLARDTPALHDQWLALNVRRVTDLTGFDQVVAAW